MTRQEAVAVTARTCIGTPFRPQGRKPGLALDCIGLAASALRGAGLVVDPPSDYALSGDFGRRIEQGIAALGLVRVDPPQPFVGDIILFAPGVRQRHLAVATENGFVHAHLGLHRVVETSRPFPWPVIGVWRIP